MNVVQYIDHTGHRRVGQVSADGDVHAVANFERVYHLVSQAVAANASVASLLVFDDIAVVEPIDKLEIEGRLLPPVDHPDPHRQWVTGTGFSHIRAELQIDELAKLDASTEPMTESVRLKHAALRDGRSRGDEPGLLNEFFIKGTGLSIVPPGGTLVAPAFCRGYSEESEIAGIYYIDAVGQPVRLGFVLGNEFADCETEKRNAYYLQHSKIMPSAIGPELRLGSLPSSLIAHPRILRKGKAVLEYEFYTGEDNMVFDLATIEHHYFKHAMFRVPGDLHVHYLGTGARPGRYLGAEYQDGDVIEIGAPSFGRPLRVTLRDDANTTQHVPMQRVRALA